MSQIPRFLLALVFSCMSGTTAYSLLSRAAFAGRFGAAIGMAVRPAVAVQPAVAASNEGSIFEGTYTDPNHPGGKREISLLPGGIGAYRLANVHGGGGIGEPASYDLPAGSLHS